MAHEIAKLILEHSGTFVERAEAVETALSMGMPLSDIEEYLDWLDVFQPRADRSAAARDFALHRRRQPKAG